MEKGLLLPHWNDSKNLVSILRQKYTSHAKQNQWLLCSGDAIVWVVGKRYDRRFAATSSTNEQHITNRCINS